MPYSWTLLILGTLLAHEAAADHVSLMQIKAQSLRSHVRGDTVLPQVETVLANSTKTFHGILKQTSLLEAALVQKEQEFRAKLVKVKEQYEAQLDTQIKENLEIKMSIAKVVDAIKKMRTESNILRNNSADLMHNNSLLRIQLKQLGSKLQTANAFAALSLNSTDDTSSSELVILNTPQPVHHREPHPNASVALENADTVEQAMEYMLSNTHGKVPFDADDEGDETDQPAGLLQVGSAVDAVQKLDYPGSMVLLSALSTGLEQVQVEYKKAQEQLKRQFEERSDAGSRERSYLLARKERATHRLKDLTSINHKLQAAHTSLLRVNGQLRQRIKGLKVFLLRVGNTD